MDKTLWLTFLGHPVHKPANETVLNVNNFMFSCSPEGATNILCYKAE